MRQVTVATVASTVSVIASTSTDPDQTNVTVFGSAADADAYYRSVAEPPRRAAPISNMSLSPNPPYNHGMRVAFEQYTAQPWTPSVSFDDGSSDRNLTDFEGMLLAAVTFAVAELAEHPERAQQESSFAQGDTTLRVTCSARVTTRRRASGVSSAGGVRWRSSASSRSASAT